MQGAWVVHAVGCRECFDGAGGAPSEGREGVSGLGNDDRPVARRGAELCRCFEQDDGNGGAGGREGWRRRGGWRRGRAARGKQREQQKAYGETPEASTKSLNGDPDLLIEYGSRETDAQIKVETVKFEAYMIFGSAPRVTLRLCGGRMIICSGALYGTQPPCEAMEVLN